MKSISLFLVVVNLVPCLGHLHSNNAVHDQRQYAELGAARTIHNIREVEQALAKDLRGNPKFLLSEERLLHKASEFALKAGEMRAMQMHSGKKLAGIEASLMQKMQDAASSSSATRFDSIARKEAQLLRGGRGILKKVDVLKADFAKTLGAKSAGVTAKLEKLMDRVDGAQREILMSETEATAHASTLAAAIRKDKAPAAGAFAQASARESSGTKDPVRRMRLTKQALSDLNVAKSEVEEAFGTDDGTAKKVEGMIDQLTGSLTGLEDGTDEVAAVTDGEEHEVDVSANLKPATPKSRAVKASLAQASAHSRSSARMSSRRFRQQSQRLRRLVQRTSRLAMEDRHISKETKFARRVVQKELGNSEIGEEVSALLAKAASEANHAAASDHRLAVVENREAHGLAHLAALAAH